MNEYTFMKDDLFNQIKVLHKIRQDHWDDKTIRDLLSCFMNILRAVYKTLDRMEIHETEIIPEYKQSAVTLANRVSGKKFKEIISLQGQV